MFSRGVWHVIKYFLDPVVRSKVVLLGGGRQPPELQKYITADNMPAEFGGEDVTSYSEVVAVSEASNTVVVKLSKVVAL